MIDHISIGVRDLAQSRDFYDAVLPTLGYRRGIDTGPLASPEAFGHVGGGGSFGYADPARRLGIGFAKNYFTYLSGGAVNGGRPPRAPSNIVTEAVFDALELPR